MSIQPRPFTEAFAPGFEGLTITLTVYDLNWNVLATMVMTEVQPYTYYANVATWDTTWSGTVKITEPTYGVLNTINFVATQDVPTVAQIGTEVSSTLTAFYASPIPVRAQDGVTTPTYNDAALGAWSAPFAAQKDNSAEFPAQFLVYLPGGSGVGVARTFAIMNNCEGQPVGRS